MSVTLRSLAALSLSALLLAGCAEEQPPITRVQPNYFDKSFFIGAEFTDSKDDPEFYSQGTLVDVGYGAGQSGLFTSTYAQPLTRVRWTVTEEWLIARLAYERISDSDGKGAGKATNDGVVVAAYPITKHFDVQRTYNPSTGEQLNVLEENTVDRPWYERQFMRVDWSKNHSTDNYDYDTLSQLGIYGGVTYQPLAYDVTNEANAEDRPRFVPEEGYLDITNKAFARPELVDISHLGWGLGVVPACWFDADFMGGSAPATGCSPVELTIRQAFLRVDQKQSQDYEPADWDGYRFQAFGAFTTERKGYARNYGMTDTQWHRFINRYNIWERSHRYANPEEMTGAIACFTPDTTPAGADPHRDENNDGTEDECAAAGSGSRCNTFTQKCTLPYRERKTAPIVWYYSNGSHPDFFEPSWDSTHDWDVAMRSAAMVARYTECKRVGSEDCSAYPIYLGGQEENDDAIALAREVDDCRNGRAHRGAACEDLAESIGTARGYSRGVIALAKMPEMVVLCHSPVEAKDPMACGSPRLPEGVTASQCDVARRLGDDPALVATCDAALNVRRGDLRYHQVNVIRTPQTPSPWGIMVDSVDPLTGESIAASINVWSHVNDLWAQGIVDTARYIKGELTDAEVTEANYIRDWAQAAQAASKGGALSPMTREDLRNRVRAFAGRPEKKEQALETTLSQIAPELKRQLAHVNRQLTDVRADIGAPTTSKPVYEARRKRAVGTPTEAQLITPMMQSYAGVDGLPNSDVVMNFASPLRAAHPMIQQDLQRMKELALAERGACMLHEAPAPFAIADLSDLLEAKFGAFDRTQSTGEQLERAAKMQKYLAHKAHYAVMTHEMGHSIGLRHNFVSSSDAHNYRPQYWQLRTDNGQNTTECLDLTPDGSCVGPRYFDPVNENERKNLITMFMQSSTMDYAGEALQDLLGLGAYDFAAARMFYADAAAVYFDDTYKVGTPRGTGILNKLDNFGGILGFRPVIGTSGTDTREFHYSQLQANYDLLWGCQEVDPMTYKPANWDTAVRGEWHPLLDGQIVQVNGKYTRCKQQPMDYVHWESLRKATDQEVGFTRAGEAIDPEGRIRVPFGFATDRWADLGNLSVYRHDNGADPYELFDFLITQQEVNHIFDNYRRGKQSFSIRGASNRTLYRYNTKLRDAAKGLGLMANIYREFANDLGYDYETLWPYISQEFFADNILASGIAFDHFARQLARPEAGPHYMGQVGSQETARVLRSAQDAPGNGGVTQMIVPNGATGQFRNIVPGGRPLENALAEDKGEYDAEFTLNAGSYYDKAWTAMLMTESVDNFISDSRRDFLDSRYRAVSLADVFPDSYRRWLSNNLTGDEFIKGTRVQSSATGVPEVDSEMYPSRGIGWTSWVGATPKTCFQDPNTLLCDAAPANTTVPVDSQVGWEQQKFLIAWTLMYLPENQQQTWLNQMNIWEIGVDNDPGFQNRIQFHSPDGRTYVAKTFGKETVFGKTVQKGISARMLEYANGLLAQAYEVNPGPDNDGDGTPDWYTPKMGTNGQPVVKYDPAITVILPNGQIVNGRPGCNATDNSQCTCTANRACMELSKFESVPSFMRQAMRDYGLADPSMKGLY